MLPKSLHDRRAGWLLVAHAPAHHAPNDPQTERKRTCTVWGMDEVTGPVVEPFVYAEYDFGVPDNPRPNAPANTETDTHGDLRKLPEGQEQMWHFFTTGEPL